MNNRLRDFKLENSTSENRELSEVLQFLKVFGLYGIPTNIFWKSIVLYWLNTNFYVPIVYHHSVIFRDTCKKGINFKKQFVSFYISKHITFVNNLSAYGLPPKLGTWLKSLLPDVVDGRNCISILSLQVFLLHIIDLLASTHELTSNNPSKPHLRVFL